MNAAEALVWNIGQPEDRRFRRRILSALPLGFDRHAAETYALTNSEHGKAAANVLLLDMADTLKRTALKLSSSDSDLCDHAAARAHACERVTLDHAQRIAQNEGIEPPAGRTMTDKGKAARLACRYWWRRKVRAAHGRNVEGAAIRLGMVHKRAALYVSDNSLSRRRGQNRRNRQMLESMQAVNELDQAYTLQQLADLSVSNPTIRRGELMTRIAGFEDYANRDGHAALFVTWTCPSRMHSHLVTGERNPKHDGTTPRDAARYLAGQWAKARAAIQRAGWNVYGFRIAEPHHDGTPHWHMLLFMQPDGTAGLCESRVRAIFTHYALEVDPGEPGASEHRCKIVAIDRSKGTAAGYVAKYVSKNIDGYGVDVDLFGKDPKKGAERVAAWASTWGIRQFQQIGGPSVTIWRELRRVSEAPAGVLEEARGAADAGEWAEFVRVMGGATAKRATRPIALLRVWSDKPGRYGEPAGYLVRGVEAGAVTLPTRVHQWKISRANAEGGTPRSPVNNCTPCKKENSNNDNEPHRASRRSAGSGPENQPSIPAAGHQDAAAGRGGAAGGHGRAPGQPELDHSRGALT